MSKKVIGFFAICLLFVFTCVWFLGGISFGFVDFSGYLVAGQNRESDAVKEIKEVVVKYTEAAKSVATENGDIEIVKSLICWTPKSYSEPLESSVTNSASNTAKNISDGEPQGTMSLTEIDEKMSYDLLSRGWMTFEARAYKIPKFDDMYVEVNGNKAVADVKLTSYRGNTVSQRFYLYRAEKQWKIFQIMDSRASGEPWPR